MLKVAPNAADSGNKEGGCLRGEYHDGNISPVLVEPLDLETVVHHFPCVTIRSTRSSLPPSSKYFRY
jgi:hypothetical protein